MTTATQRQLRRGTTAQISGKTPASGEMWADTSIAGRLVVGDGVTAGGKNVNFNSSGLLDGTRGGVQFPASQVSSADPNALDDYEEGSFTPTLKINASIPTGLTYATQVGSYTKVGNRVHFTARITLSAKGSSTGVVTLESMPFSSVSTGSQYYSCSVHFSSMGSSVNAMTAFIRNSASNVALNRTNAGTSTFLADTDLTNTSDIIVTGCYQTS